MNIYTAGEGRICRKACIILEFTAS